MNRKVPYIVVIAIILAGCAFHSFLTRYTAQKHAAVFSLHLHEYRDANDTLRANANLSKTLAVLFGDSRIKHWRMVQNIGGTEIANRGISGETTPQMLARFSQDVLALNPTVIILQGGINDLVAIGVLKNESRSIIEASKRNIETMIEAARRQGIPIIVLTIVQPAEPPFYRRIVWSNKIKEDVEEVNRFINELGDRTGVAVLDANSLLGANEHYLSNEYSTDTLHWNNKAYIILTEHLEVLMNNVDAL